MAYVLCDHPLRGMLEVTGLSCRTHVLENNKYSGVVHQHGTGNTPRAYSTSVEAPGGQVVAAGC